MNQKVERQIENDDNKLGNFVQRFYEIKAEGDNYKIELRISRKSGENKLTEKLNSIASKNEVSDNIYKVIQNNSESIGMVFYMEKGYSNDPEENAVYHIPFLNQGFYPKIIEKIVFDYLKVEVDQIVVGHEHGDLNRKCHLQTCIRFKKKFSKILNTGYLVIENTDTDEKVKLLFMQQKARNSKALWNYCLKDNDYEFLFPDKALKFQKKKNGTIDAFKTLVQNKESLNKEEAENLILIHDPVKYFSSFINIQKALDKVFVETLEPFEWKQPYIPEGFTIPIQNERVLFKPIFDDWFKTYCLGNVSRKKALCLYSKQRALGKTTFARSLVNDPGYILEYNHLFTDQKIQKRKEQLKLLLLDDVIITSQNIQTWRSIIAGEKTTIRGLYLAETYELNLPCIITTNDLELVTRFVLDSTFNTQVLALEIDNYIGPPETKRNDLMKREYYLSQQTLEELTKCEADMEKKKKNY